MEKLTNQEISSAKEIIDLGLKKAAQSLSFFMKEDISLKETDFTLTDEQSFILENSSLDDNLFVLSTEIKGELKGICYLIFNKEEKDEVCRVALPAEIFNNPEKLKNMQEPLLLEIDNIISASVITQIANSLKMKMYGDVPKLELLNSNELKNVIISQMKPNKLIIGFQTEFISSKANFSPEFFWIFEPEFIESVKSKLIESAS